ncbi:lysophospholipid acyltransferase family protein [Anaeromyxobacter terrae]|uniref:lysophospholipid acyltransferase family protein n=1 Tax=Anaeromyxobacter terrae TaxID=2925406 RepID=UPI001F55F50F|nr:lysophospholipid acyltransferase family protein [Anaeromyxobacter sp. SG22]
MPGGKRRGRAGAGKRTPRARKAGARARPEPKPARPVLGNDPFARGAAPREPAPEVTRVAGSRPTPTPTPTPRHAPSPSPNAPTDRIRAAGERLGALEQRVESTLAGLEHRLGDVAARAGLASAAGELRETVARLLPRVKHALGTAIDLARLLEPPERLDRYGLDARFHERAQPLLDLLYATWWRTEARGLERVPGAGAAIVVANHAGVVPWDALVLRHALHRDHPARRDLRPLLDDREAGLPLFGPLAIRLGAVRAAPEPAERILRDGALVGVFPEGSAVARKAWGERYHIERFGRGGFVKLALRTGAPVIPCAIVGSEEASPAISRPGWLGAALGLAALPTDSLRVGAAALLPLPSRWSLRFGDPIDLGEAGPEAADDPSTVSALTERTRSTLQAMLDEDLAARRSVFL